MLSVCLEEEGVLVLVSYTLSYTFSSVSAAFVATLMVFFG